MEKQIVEAIIEHPIVHNTIDKQCRKYEYLYDDLRGDLILLTIESIYKFEKNNQIWDKLTPKIIREDITKDGDLKKFKYQLLKYLYRTISCRSIDIAQQKKYMGGLEEEIPAPPPSNYRTYYKQYFWDNFHKLTKRQQQFCIDYINGEKMCRVQKHYIIGRIQKRLGGENMNVKRIMIEKEKEYIKELLESLTEDNFIEVIIRTMDRQAGQWVLYEYMDIGLRRQLILYTGSIIVGAILKTPIREIPLEAVEQYLIGLIEWTKR